MTRRVLNLATGLSVLLCVAVVALWVQSYWGGALGYHWRAADGPVTRRGGWCISFDRGSIGFFRQVVGQTLSDEADVREYEPAAEGETSAIPEGIAWSTDPVPDWYEPVTAPPTFQWSWHGFEILVRTDEVDANWWFAEHAVTLPAWLLSILTAALPALWLLRFTRARRRMRSGLCPACGYDLTDNLSGLCPECGTTTASTS